MAIGYETSYYTLVEQGTGVVHKFNAGTMAVINGEYVVQKQGDDFVLALKDVIPNTTGGYKDFNINGLVGAHVRMKRVSAGYEAFIVTFYEGSYSASSVVNRVFQFDNVRADSVSWSNFGMLKKGMFICFMPNAPYEGSHVLPATFPCVNSGNMAVKSPVVGFPVKYSNVAAYTYEDAKIPSMWYTGNVVPATRLLKLYPTLGYSDSGDVSKQGLLVIKGFPYGENNKYMSTPADSGQGEMQDTSTPIVVDGVRTLFVGQLFRLYKLSVVELSALSNFLLSASFLDNVKKLFTDPMDYLTSLVAIPTGVFSGTSETLTIGGVSADGVTGVRLSNFIADVDCGEIRFEEFYKTFMDFSPYTKVTLFLPFVGYVNINIDAFQNNALKVKYRIDALTGQCVVFLSNNEGLVATHCGNCGYHIPLRSREYGQMISGLLNVGVSVASGNVLGATSPILNGSLKVGGSISSGGTLSGNTGILTNRKPYIIIERPHISLPDAYGKTIGYVSKVYAKLGDLTGYTVVESIHLEHVNAPDEEKRELEALLKSGVIL